MTELTELLKSIDFELKENNKLLRKISKSIIQPNKRSILSSPDFDKYQSLAECFEKFESGFMTASDASDAILSEYGSIQDGFGVNPNSVGKVLSHFFKNSKCTSVKNGISVKGYSIKLKDI